jgi:hypothetical protein
VTAFPEKREAIEPFAVAEIYKQCDIGVFHAMPVAGRIVRYHDIWPRFYQAELPEIVLLLYDVVLLCCCVVVLIFDF